VAFPLTELPLTVRMAFGADLTADPGTWSFTDMSARLVDGPIDIARGVTAGGQSATSTVSLELENSDGELSPDNAESSLFPDVEQDVPIEILAGVGDVTRFEGFCSSYQPSFLPSTDGVPLSVMRIDAAGIRRRLEQAAENRPLGSPIRRTMSGVTPGDYVPYQYWPLEDGSDATQAGSGLPNGQPMALFGDAQFAANADLESSEPLVTLAAGASLTATIPTYTDTGQWATQLFVSVPSEPASEQVYAEWRSTGTAKRITFCVIPGSPTQVGIRVYDSTGASLGTYFRNLDGSGSQQPSEADFYAHWALYAVGLNDDFGSPEAFFGLTTDTNINQYGGASAGASLGRITSVTLYGATTGASFGHLGVFTDAAYSFLTDAETTAAAIDGHANETTVDRWNRLLTEERIRHSVTGTSTQTMGRQPNDASLIELLDEIVEAEQGASTEKDWGLHLITRSARYNLAVGLVVDLATYRTAASAAAQVLSPTYDDQGYINRWTVQRTDGSEATVQASDAEIARRNVYAASVTVNLGSDADPVQHAAWRVNRDILNRVRYPDTPIDVGENTVVDSGFIDDWFALELGAARVQRTNVPGLHGVGTIDEVLGGYRERLERKRLTVSYNGSPYAPYIVAELDDDDSAKLDTDGSDLTAAVNSSATSLSVATQTGLSPLWTTDGGEMPIPLYVGGEVMSVTAIAAPTIITYGAVGTATHASNASVTPGIPASVAAGNLLIVIAAIRNSGTGVPNTPTGYTRLDVFGASDNVQVFAKVAVGGDSAPAVSFTGGVAFSAPDEAFVRGQALLNSSAQDIAYPGLPLEAPTVATAIHNAIIIYVGWKQDDWTSVASPGTEIAEASSTTGDDQGLVWAYQIQTTATNVVEGSFTVTGGAAAISRGAVFAVRSNVQAFTVTRSINGVAKSHAAGAAVNVYKPARLAL
jgi:hypothetical protein